MSSVVRSYDIRKWSDNRPFEVLEEAVSPWREGWYDERDVLSSMPDILSTIYKERFISSLFSLLLICILEDEKVF